MITIKYAYMGKKEYRGFIGNEKVSMIHEVGGQFYPTFKSIPGRALPTLEAAKTWVVMQFKHFSKKK